MIVDGAVIDTLHRSIQIQVQSCLGYPVLVLPARDNGDGWKRAAPGSTIVFRMRANDAEVWSRRAVRTEDTSVTVFPILEPQPVDLTAWADWYEEWLSEGNDRFELVGLSWTFYWGAPHEEKKNKLFRAEWDDPTRRGSTQPHWHFDREIHYIGTRPIASQQNIMHGGGLEEITEAEPLVEIRPIIQPLHLSGLHLGMGWQEKAPHPKCWQRAPKLEDLKRWTGSTLRHAMSEFQRLRAGDAEAV